MLWRPGKTVPRPRLWIGRFQNGTSDPYADFREIPLTPNLGFRELWEVAAKDCNLIDGEVYFYWFKIYNTNPYPFTGENEILYCTDPFATTIDRGEGRLAPQPPDDGGVVSDDPASVILYNNGMLMPCDPNGRTPLQTVPHPSDRLASNNRLVIYELPTRWTKKAGEAMEMGTGTFRDAVALLDKEAIPPDFPHVTALKSGIAHLRELGVNALELLPPADSEDIWEWGYGTANFLAADFHLGCPEGQHNPTPLTDLAELADLCHKNGLRFFIDIVMAFARGNPYGNINFLDFFIKWNSGDPEQGQRDGFGGDLFKYNYWVEGYHPVTGTHGRFVPSREYMKVYIAHWLEQYCVDGLRLDSINNIDNYDFLQEFNNFARQYWHDRGGESDRFLVVGEDLSVPIPIVHQKRLDGLWNEKFKHILRQVILGENGRGDSSFEWSIRKLIDCRYLGFSNGTQAINYITSHDVGGAGNERLFDYLVNCGVYDTEKRIELAFVCLLTAVGIPMILAGEEFADQHDLDIAEEHGSHKQIDPVNYDRLQEDWRQRIFTYVSRLVKLRTTSDALASDDTDFLHVDYSAGKKVIVWQRGREEDRVIVLANFSDYGTPDPFDKDSEYVVPNWPPTPPGKYWQEITRDRVVLPQWVGREPIFPWEAKVYTLVDG
ncbi:MAG: alpha-amylase family glycosyl hydrolase [Spirulina sp.]